MQKNVKAFKIIFKISILKQVRGVRRTPSQSVSCDHTVVHISQNETEVSIITDVDDII